MAQDVTLPDGQIASFPDEMDDAQITRILRRDFPQWGPKQTAESGIIGTLGGGTAQTIRAVGAAADLAQHDTPELQAAAAEQAARVKDPRLAAFEADLAQRRAKLGADPGWLDVIGEVGSAAWKNPAGAGLMAVDQLPNSAAVLAGAGVGAAAGSMIPIPGVGTAAGGIIGGLAGMYAGNLAVEGGNRALEHVGKTGDLSSEDRSRLIYEGAIKAGVITGVDAATFGMTKFLTNAARRAVETATLRVAEQAGVTTAAEIAARRAADPAFDSAVVAAQKLAMDGATTFGKRALQTGAALGLETIGEGLGEYLGEFAATGEADKMDAVIEAFSSLGQSAAEVGIAKVWNSRNIIAPIAAAKTPDDAIAAADAALSAPIDTLSSAIDAFKNEWETPRIPADSALPMIGMPADTAAPPALVLPDQPAPASQPIEVPRALPGPALLALAEQVAAMAPAEQTKALMRLDAPMRQAVVRAMQPSGIVTPTVLDPGMGEAARITNEATMAASSVQPTGDAAVTNVPALTQRAAQEIVSKSSGMEMRPHREVAGRFEVVPVASTAGPGRAAPPTLQPPVGQQILADQESPAMPTAPAAPAVVTPAPLTAEQRAANQAAADAERSSQPRPIFGQNSQLRSETGPDIKGEKVTRNMRKVLAVMGRITGTKVVFEYAPDSSEGAVPKRGENTIHINTAADINPMQVMGHEVTHVLRDRHAAAWAKVRDALVATMPDKRKGLDDFAANYWGTPNNAGKLAAARAMPDWSARLTPEQKQTLEIGEDTIEAFLLEEMVSDLGGKHWTDEKFWLDVFAKIEKAEGAKAKGIIERLVIAIRETLTKMLAVIRAQGQGDYSTISVEQITATRDAISSAYAEFIRAERRTEPDGEPHVTDHRIRTSDTHSRSTGAESEPQPAAAPVPATGDTDELSDARSRELASLSPSRPAWWDEPSTNAFAKGMTQGEVIQDALDRATSNGSLKRVDDKYVFFHATPDKTLTELRAGSLLEYNAKDAKHHARHNRGLRLKDVVAHELHLLPEQLNPPSGPWFSLRDDVRLSPSRPDQRLFFEAAPNPDDKAAMQQWRAAGKFGRDRIDAAVRRTIVPGLLRDLKVTGEIVPQLGGWMDATNPSFALVVSRGDPALAARAIGYVLDQQAMYMLGLERFTGAEKTGIIHFDIAGKDAHKIYMQVRALASDVISGHSTVGNEMYIGVPADRMQALRQSVVEIARTNNLTVSFDEGYGATIKEYGYGIQGERQVARGLRATARDVDRWRAEADALRSDAAGRGSDRTGAVFSSNRPSYGTVRTGTGVSAVGVHYSQAERKTLSSRFFGTGMKGEERARIMHSNDERLKRRLYFYTNEGSGITPESGVGSHAHSVLLNNIYDIDADPDNLIRYADPSKDWRDQPIAPSLLMNYTEAAVIDAGYDGYMSHKFGRGGAVVLLGDHSVPVKYEGAGARPDVPVAPKAEPNDYIKQTARIAARKDLPAGQMTGAEWKRLVPDMDLSHLQDDKLYHKSALVATPVRRSESRPMLAALQEIENGKLTMEGEYGYNTFQSLWNEAEGMRAEYPDERTYDLYKDNGGTGVVYGAGGYNRYAVTQDGTLRPIPESFSNKDKLAAAQAALAAPVARLTTQRPPAWWYSPLARQADAATMKKAPASGWKSWLKSLAAKGVKPDEIKWSGIEEWLDVQGEAVVTREQVQAYLSEFGVRIETILRGERNPIRPVTDTEQEVDDEDIDIELNVGDWQTDDPDDYYLAERAGERLEEAVDERIESEADDIESDLRAAVVDEINPSEYRDEVLQDMGALFDPSDEEVRAEAKRRAVIAWVNDMWQGFADDTDITLEDDEDAIETAMNRAFDVAMGDLDATRNEAERRARAEIDEDKLLEELIEQERNWYYDDDDSPQTRQITVDGVDGTFYDSTSYGERNVYYDGQELTLPRRADDADVEGAIRQFVIEEGLVTGRSGDAGGYRAVKWEGYATDKSRAVPGSYREVQLTLPVGAFGLPKTRMREDAALNYYDDKGDLIGTTINEDRAKERADNMGGRVEPASPVQTARVTTSDFYYTTHWQEANVIGHARWDEHTDSDGKRVLVLQEVQGDWGQQRREGLEAQEAYEIALVARDTVQKRYDDAYDAVKATGVADSWRDHDWRDVAMSRDKIDWDSVSTEQAAAITELQAAYAAKEKAIREANEAEHKRNDLPDAAPFIEKTPQWAGLVLKRMIAHAIEYGFDKVVWTTGAQQVERWKGALRKEVDTIAWEKTPDGIHIVASQNGRQRTDTRVSETALSDAIGKQMAKQIIADPNQSGEITGDDITISDTGMAGFYDRMLPTIANDILRKFDKDVRVSEQVVHEPDEFDTSSTPNGWVVLRNGRDDSQFFDTENKAVALKEKIEAAQTATAITTQQGFEITDKLRESAAAGMPLFSQRRASAEARKSEARKEWYRSQLSEAIGNLPAKIKTGKEAALWLTSNAGKLQVKKDELAWSGVLDWLATQRSVTGAQIQDWLASNGVRVRTVMLGGEDSPEYKRLDAELQEQDAEVTRLRKIASNLTQDEIELRAQMSISAMRDAASGNDRKLKAIGYNQEQYDAMLEYGKALNRKNELFEQRKAARGETPKHDSGSLRIPGGKPGTYRELLLVLPSDTAYDKGELTKFKRAMADKYNTLNWEKVATEAEQEKHNEITARFDRRKEQFTSSHYTQPNILAHLRFEEMIDADGKRVMFIQEVQSDWGQKGRKEGFAGTERTAYQVVVDGNPAGAYESMAEAEAAKQRALKYNTPEKVEIRPVRGKVQDIKSVPAAPFVTDTKAWVALALKRAISHAVDNGFDRVAWTTGEQQNDRYDLSKQVSYIRAIRNSDDTYWVLAVQNREGRGGTGDILFDKDKLTEAELENTIGKDLTQKIIKQEKRKEHEYTGLDLKVGGEGMVAFYDGIVKQVARSLGATVGTVSLPNPYRPSASGMTLAEADVNMKIAQAAWKPTTQQPGFDITERMKEQAAVGMPLFSERRAAPALDKWLGKSVVRGVMYHGTSRDISEFRPKQADAIFLTDDPKFAADFADLSHSWMLNNYWLWMTQDQIAAMKRTALELLLQDTIPGSPLYLRETRYMDGSQTTSQYTRRAVELFMPSESNIMPLYVRAENPFDYRNPAHVKAIEDVLGGSWLGQEFINGEMHEVSQHIGDLERGDWNAIESEKVQAYIRANHDSFYVRERGVTNLAVFSPNQVKSASGNNGEYDNDNNDIRYSEARRALPDEPQGNRTLDATELRKLRRVAARLERPKDGVYLTVTADGQAVATGTPRTAIPDTFRKFAAENNLTFVARRRGPGSGIAGEERGERMPSVYREDGAQYASEIGDGYIDRTDRTRFSTPRSRLTGQPINQTWTDPDVTDWDDFVRKMQDSLIDTKRILRAIREAGVAVAERFDPYLQETLYHGRASSRVKEFTSGEMRKLLEDMSHRGVTVEDVHYYMWARHAPERNAANARTNPAITDGSGMTDAQAADILAGRAVTLNGETVQLSAAALRGLPSVATKVEAITNGTLDLLVQYKLETQATVDTWKRTYTHYIPLKRDMESDANYSGAFNLGAGTGSGFDVRGAASRRALGSKRKVIDILANVAMQRERAIVRGEKNRVAQAVYGLALTAPNPEFWIPLNPTLNKGLSPAALAKVVAELVALGVNPLDAQNIAREPVQRYIDPNTGLEATRINPALRNRDNVMSARINGEDRYVMFSNKKRAQRAVSGLKNLDAPELSGALQVIAPVTRWFAAVNTQYNPVFGLTNGIRDLFTGMLNLSSTPLSGHRAEIARNAWSALIGVYIDLRDHRAGRTPSSQWAQLFEQFQADGGQTGYRDMFLTSEDRAKDIAEELKHAGKGQQWLAVGEKHSHIFGWLSDYNTAVENAMRLSSYKAALDSGMSRDAAASLAKNLTVNFNKKGLAAVQTGALYAFFNAAVQGTARIAETTSKDGKLTTVGQKIVYGGMMVGVLQAFLGMLAGWDDEEPPQFQREKNFLIPLPGSDKYLSVPMPLGFHVLPNIGRITTELLISGGRDSGKKLSRLANVLLDAFNPIGSGTFAQTLSPTIGDPIVSLAENKDWTGKNIYKEDFSKLQPTAGWTRAKDVASPPSRWLSYAVNYITGGGKYEIGMASPTPDQLDYLVGQATGGVGREVLKLTQFASSKVTGEELPIHKTPLGVGRFIGETKGQASETSKFYRNLERIGAHKSAMEEMKDAGDRDALLRYMERNPDARLVQTADKAQREIGYLRRQKRELIEKGANKERIKMIEDKITGLTGRYNEVLGGRK